MAQDWRNEKRREDRDDEKRYGARPESIGQRAFGHDQSTGEAPTSGSQEQGDYGRRPAGGWQDPDRTYAAEARGEHQSHDPWSESRGYGRFGYGAPSGYGASAPRQGNLQGMGGHDPYGQHGLGGEHYGEGRQSQDIRGSVAGGTGDGRIREGGYGRRPGGEGYDGYGAQDQGWGRGDQGRGDFGPPPRHGFGDGSHQHHMHHDEHFDPEYARWRAEQISKLDEDYRAWRQERQSRFNDEFETWRKGRTGSGSPFGQQQNPSRAGGEYLPAGHNETMKMPATSGLDTSATGGDNPRPTEDDLAKREDPSRK